MLFEQISGSLKEKLQAIIPRLEEMKNKKNERKSQIAEVQQQINSISKELYRSTEENLYTMFIEESDLSLRRLEELKHQLLSLQKEKVIFHLSSVICCLEKYKRGENEDIEMMLSFN